MAAVATILAAGIDAEDQVDAVHLHAMQLYVIHETVVVRNPTGTPLKEIPIVPNMDDPVGLRRVRFQRSNSGSASAWQEEVEEEPKFSIAHRRVMSERIIT